MKKPIVVLLSLALISAISMAVISPAKAAFNFGDWRPIYVSKDSNTVIYRDGLAASCIVGYTNTISVGFMMNVSKIIFNFNEIGKNKTLDLTAAPQQLLYNQPGIWTVSFTADGSEFFSGRAFDYRIIIEYVNATSGPTRVVGSSITTRSSASMPRFMVYPAAQADASDSLAKYDVYYDTYGTGYFDSVLGRQKANQAILEKGTGDIFWNRGDYASAFTHYNSSNSLWQEALTAEFNWRTKWEDAELNIILTNATATLTVANAAKAQADAAVTNAYGWYFVGIGFAIGWSLMGLGVVIWAWRRPKPPPV